MTVNYAERVALVGPNGAGKSTLFSLILKQDEPDAGEVIRDEWTTMGYLPQESEPVGQETILDVATGKAGEIEKLETLLSEHEARGDVSAPEYNEAHSKHDALNDPQAEAKAKKILKGFGFKEADFNKPAREYSGGWVMRAHLAQLLVIEPDLLLLDEPTNHLDLLSLMWFKNYLKVRRDLVQAERSEWEGIAGAAQAAAITEPDAGSGGELHLDESESAPIAEVSRNVWDNPSWWGTPAGFAAFRALQAFSTDHGRAPSLEENDEICAAAAAEQLAV